ncbi:MAG TPA: HEAT repeat domain-containing protein, partial [Acidimicrobiia bacterium]
MSAPGQGEHRLLASVGIRSDELSLARWMTALFAVTQASHGVGANAADSLFFRRFGVEDLPLMILLSGPAVMIAIVSHSAGLARRGAQRWLVTIMSLTSVWVGALWVSIFFGTNAVYPVIWISTQVLIFLTLTVIWNAAGSACTTRQAKRLFPLFATAAVAGGVVGNLMVGPLAALFGTGNLLLVEALLVAVATLVVRRVTSFFEADTDDRQSMRVEMGRAISSIRSSRLLRLAAVVVFLLFALFFLVVFPFSEAVAATFQDEVEMAGFLGVFSSVATGATFGFSLLGTRRLFSRLGLVMTLLTVPAVYLLGFSAWLLTFGIVSATVFRGLQWVAVNSVQATAYSALFNVLSSGRRGPVMALMTAVPAQLGTMTAGAILLFGDDLLSQTGLFVVGAVMAAVAVAVVAVMRPAYVSAVVDAVRRGLVTVWDAPHSGLITPVDRDVVQVLKSHLSDPRPRARAIAVAGLGHLGGGSAVAEVQALLDDEDPLVRAAAFQSMCQIEPDALEPHLVGALADESADVRLNAIHYIDSSGQGEVPVATLAAVVEDPDPRVRAAGAWMAPREAGATVVQSMVSSGDVASVRAVFDEMVRHPGETMGLSPLDHIDDEDAGVRAAAVAAVASGGGDLSRIVPSLDDRSVRVRRAAAEALAGTEEGRSLLIGVLREGSVLATQAALDALTPMESFDPHFTGWAASEAERAAFLARHHRVLERQLDSPHGRYLVRVLDARVDRLIHWVLRAMTTSKTKEIMPLVSRGVDSDDPETNAQAVEALESVGDRSVLVVLLPLLEPAPEGQVDLTPRDALEELADDFDPWLRRLARQCLAQEEAPTGEGGAMASWGGMAEEHVDTLDEMGRVLVLQRVPMFSDLDPEDLLLVTRFTREVRFDPDDYIYREGDAGTELLVIVEGAAVVSRTRDGAARVIRTFREGEHVGELS